MATHCKQGDISGFVLAGGAAVGAGMASGNMRMGKLAWIRHRSTTTSMNRYPRNIILSGGGVTIG